MNVDPPSRPPRSTPDPQERPPSDGDGEPIVPRLPRVFDATTVRRLAAEFVIIVVGVLVAFAVEDWQAGREQRDEALRLLRTMEVDIRESVADLREAAASARVRQSAIVEILDRLGAPLPPAEEWTPMDEWSLDGVRGLAQAPGLEGGVTLRTLLLITIYAQVFDPRTVAYDEFRSTGALASIPDPSRDDVAAFYGAMLDFAESNQFIRDQGRALEAALESAGLAANDWLPDDEIVERLGASPRAQASLRRAYMRAMDQARSLPEVADRLEEEGEIIIAGARAGM